MLMPLLHALVQLDIYYLQFVGAPPLYRSGVRYREEPPGCEDWDTIPVMLRRGWGDCEDLAAWRVAELVLRGVQARPAIRWKPRRVGGTLFHIVVRLPDGRIEDPSRRLGMGTPSARYRGA